MLPQPEDDSSSTSWSFPGDEDEKEIGEDLPPADPSADMTERASALRLHETPEEHAKNESLHTHFAAGQPAPEMTSQSQQEDLDRLAQASTKDHPLGVGVSKDTHVGKDGLLYRRMPDGSVVSAPEDDVALGIEDAREGKLGAVEQHKVDKNFTQ